MLKMLKEKLAALSCDGWELTEKKVSRWEFYFIGHRLDQNRSAEISEIQVRVYKKSADGAFLGNASDVIPPTASETEIDETLKKLVFQASLVKNPVYTLNDVPVTVPEMNTPVDVSAIAGDCIQAIAAVPEDDEAKINSYEIFVSSIRRHTENSNGVSYTCTYPSTEIEVVVNARKADHEIELHRIYDSGTCDKERLTRDIMRVMDFGRDRLMAQPTPAIGTGDVLLSTADAVGVYACFSDKMHADYVVRKLSDFKVGQPVSAEMTGDKVTLKAVPELENSSMNYPVDDEGSMIEARHLIRDGIAENYCGSRQFSRYLGLEKSSKVTNLVVEGGAHTEEEIRSGSYLEVVEFSDFQVDSMSGDIAGEIRLGYLHKDGEMQIVTGGSVSGNMSDVIRDMQFSKETIQYNNWVIPRVTLLKNLRITGINQN